MPFKTIFFDLDHTLWDFDTNSTNTLLEIVEKYELISHGLPSTIEFISCYQSINEKMWEEYRLGLVDRTTLRNTRFHKALLAFGIDNYDLSLQLGDYYVKESPLKKNLFPHALETLTYLKKKYELHIITNGFNEVQFIKLENSLLAPFFTHIITSEAANSKKPESEIFDYALKLAQAKVEDCVMIGDSLAQDIAGARNFGMKQIFFNPNKIQHTAEVSYEINSLHELKEIL
jgi:putative hydrolase of the HAD superfamily